MMKLEKQIRFLLQNCYPLTEECTIRLIQTIDSWQRNPIRAKITERILHEMEEELNL